MLQSENAGDAKEAIKRNAIISQMIELIAADSNENEYGSLLESYNKNRSMTVQAKRSEVSTKSGAGRPGTDDDKSGRPSDLSMPASRVNEERA